MGLTTVTRTWPPAKGGSDSVDAAWYEEYVVAFTTQSRAAIARNAAFKYIDLPAHLKQPMGGRDSSDVGIFVEQDNAGALGAAPLVRALNLLAAGGKNGSKHVACRIFFLAADIEQISRPGRVFAPGLQRLPVDGAHTPVGLYVRRAI